MSRLAAKALASVWVASVGLLSPIGPALAVSGDLAGPGVAFSVPTTGGTSAPPTRGDMRPGVRVLGLSVQRGGKVVKATVVWDQRLSKAQTRRHSVRLLTLAGGVPSELGKRVSRSAPAKARVTFSLGPAKAAKLQNSSSVTVSATQQSAATAARAYNRSYVALASTRKHLRSGLTVQRSRQRCESTTLKAGANAQGCNFTGANLSNTDLRRIDLTRANLTGANLRNANLAGANLAGANLAGANLAGANLAGANMQGAVVTGAALEGANVLGSKGTVIGVPASGPIPGNTPSPSPGPGPSPGPTAPSTPNAPTSPAVASNAVTLSWTPPASDGGSAITGYNVQVSTSASGSYVNATGCSDLGDVLSCTASGLTNGTPYYFKVAAKNVPGLGAYSAASAGFVPVADATAPGVPTSLSSSSQGDQIVTLTWSAPVSDGGSPVTGYNVQVSTTAGGSYGNATGCTNMDVVLTCTASGLTNGTDYYFKIAAKNAIGTGLYSAASGPFVPEVTCADGGPCEVGDLGPGGGTVFYAAGSVQPWGQYLELAPKRWNNSDDDPTAQWGIAACYDNAISTLSAIGSGIANTSTTITACGDSAPAATLARSYRGGGYEDWSLPSKDELSEIATQWELLGYDQGSVEYWSSTTFIASQEAWAWLQPIDFANPPPPGPDYNSRNQTLSVRPIRAF